jgi:hypothetical protein
LNAEGQGEFSDVMCGIDWVTANAGVIEVANMSLGGEAEVGSCTDGSLHEAVCRSVNAGVTYVVAAGNSSLDSSTFVPAAYPEVITVSAIVDTDGLPGSRGSTSFFYGDDDEFATFSNFGAPVDIAAPGVSIYSTWPGGGYTYLSGTSQASPHVAGAAALYRFIHPSATTADVKGGLLAVAWAQNSSDGFTGDSDGFAEPLLNVGSIGGNPLPPPQPDCTISLSDGVVGSIVNVSCVNFGASELVRIYWDSTGTTAKKSFAMTADGVGSVNFTIPDSVNGQHQIIAKGNSSGFESSKTFTVKPNAKVLIATAKAGGSLSVTLNGFAAGTAVALTWDNGSTSIGGATTSATGSATVYLTVPEAVAGPHAIKATPSGSPAPVSETSMTIIPSLGLLPSAGKVGANVTVTLRGYASGEQIAVKWFNSSTNSNTIASVTASNLGSATASFTVPVAANGPHSVEGAGSLANTASANYKVTSGLVLTPTSGPVSTNITIGLSGYGANETVELRWYDTSTTYSPWSSVVTDASGSASLTLPAREGANGLHRVEAVGPIGGTALANFTVAAGVAFSPVSGEAGDTVTVSLTGYRAGETITVKWFSTQSASTIIATATTSTTGSATASFTIPADATAGVHKVEATGTASLARASANFSVVSDDPPPPTDPTCILGASTGSPGISLAITCSNFANSESVRVYWDDTASTQKASIWTGTVGGGSGSFTVPDATTGAHQVIGIGTTSGKRAEATFTIVPSLKLSLTSGKAGTSVTATLKGFGAGQVVPITWDGGANLVTITTSAVGSGSANFGIPEATGGQHTVAAGSVSAPFAVVAGISLSPSTGNAGTAVVVTLRGYSPGEAVSITWFDNESTNVAVATATASALGSASANFTVPDAAKGAHRVDGVGSLGSAATSSFTVSPKMVLSPTTGTVGSNVELTLTGYGLGELVTVQWFDTTTTATTIASITTNNQGRASGTLVIPDATNGQHKVQANGSISGATLYQYLNVKSAVALSPASGPAGTTVIAEATGFKANETVSIAWFSTTTASTVVASGQTNPFGRAVLSFAVPANATAGDHKVEAAGQPTTPKATGVFSVTGPPVGGTSAGSQSVESAPSTFDFSFTDDFSAGALGELPPGWSLASASDSGISMQVKGNGNSRVSASGNAASGGSWLIRDGASFSQADVQIKLRFQQEGSAAGIVLAWNGPNDYVAMIANADLDRIELIEVSGGVVRTSFATAKGEVRFDVGSEYWLRAESGSNASGNRWVTLSWSNDGRSFETIASVQGLNGLGGGVGLFVAGPRVPKVDFDDVSVMRGVSPAPVVVEETVVAQSSETPTPEPTAAAEPTATLEPPAETPTPEPTETVEAVPTEEPISTAEPTATATPVPTQEHTVEAPSDTPAPVATEPVPATEDAGTETGA